MSNVEETFPDVTDVKAQNDKPRKKPSKARREKANERYRGHKNEATYQKRVAETEARLNGPLPEGFVLTPLPSLKPIPLSINIFTSSIPTLVDAVVRNAVFTHKVATDNILLDLIAVNTVTALQMTAKVYYSRFNSGVNPLPEDLIIKTVANTCNNALSPLALAIGMIGTCEVEGQLIIPDFVAQDRFNILGVPQPNNLFTRGFLVENDVLPLGFPNVRIDTNVILNGRQLIVGIPPEAERLARGCGLVRGRGEALVLQPIQTLEEFNAFQIQCGDMLVSHFVGPTDFTSRIDRYLDFINRCQRRLANKIVAVELKRGVGTAAQLVSALPQDPDGYSQVWSPRKISDKDLTLGGLLRFGQPDGQGVFLDAIRREEYALMRVELPTVGWTSRFTAMLLSAR